MESVKDRDKILGARRDLLGDPLCVEVLAWMRPLYLRPPGEFPIGVAKIIAEIASLLEPAAKKEGKVRILCENLSKFMAAPVPQVYVGLFDSIKRPHSSLLGTFVAAVYARALLLLAASEGHGAKVLGCFRDVLADPAKFEKGLAPQKRLDERFIGHMVTLVEVEAQLDPYFQYVLKHSADLFAQTHRPSDHSANPKPDPKSGMESLSPEHRSSWWLMPIATAFALSIWDQEVA